MSTADIAQAVPLLAQLGYEVPSGELTRRLREVFSTPDHAVLVAEIGGRFAGLLHVFARPALENPREAVVQAIVVDETYRRASLGRALMAAAEHWGKAHNCRSVMLISNATRAPAHSFYAALGYRVSATSLVLRKLL
jgi:GNAT superfamily N-acetyltransferase